MGPSHDCPYMGLLERVVEYIGASIRVKLNG